MKYTKTLTLTFLLSLNFYSLYSQQTTTTVVSTPSVQAAVSPNNSNSPQQEGIYKHTRFGIRFNASYNSFNVLSKTMTNDEGMTKIGGGLLMETRLTKNVEFQTGIGVDVFGAKITYSNDASGVANTFTNRFLYDSAEEQIVKYAVADKNKTGYLEYMLEQRTYKITYLTIPFNLRMKTNNINGFKYFGQVGADFQVRWSAYANDRARLITDTYSTTPIELGASQDLSRVRINEDVSLMNVAINIGIGAQYEVGGVDFFMSFNYHFGVFSPVDKESEYTNKVYQTNTGVFESSKLKQEYRTRVLSLTLGFMF
jgi:hypothetical protein